MRISFRTSLTPAVVCPAAMIAAVTVCLVLGHNVMGFSDPNHWLYRAVKLYEGEPQLRRVILFPFFLGGMLRVLGSAWISLVNLPFVLWVGIASGLLAVRGIRRGGERRGTELEVFVFAVGFAAMFLFQLERWIVLLNPYRDAGGVALLFSGWLLFLRSEERESGPAGFAAALVCALSVGFRETTLIACVPLGVWMGIRVWRTPRAKDLWRRICWMAVGALLGLLPFFVQNHLYSGYFFLPAYSARNIVEAVPEDEVGEEIEEEADMEMEEEAEERPVGVERGLVLDGVRRLNLRADRLVPGARPEYFRRTTRTMLLRYLEIFGVVPLLVAGVGVVGAIRRKNGLILGLLLPTFVLTFLFYGFYFKVHWRYVIFLYSCMGILVGVGAGELLGGAARLLRREERWFGRVGLGVFSLGFLVWTVWQTVPLSPNRVKAWEIPVFREEMRERLEAPRTFLGFYHQREMLAWFVDEGFNHDHFGTYIHWRELQEKGLDQSLKDMRAEWKERNDAGALYFHGTPVEGQAFPQHTPTLLPLWAKVEPVVDLKDLSVTLYRYGRPMDDIVYQVVPWRETRRDISLPAAGSQEDGEVLVLNARRLWDDPERSEARLDFDGELWVERVRNGSWFYELPAGAGESEGREVTLVSDRPVPRETTPRLWSRNQELLLPFGAQMNHWYEGLLSSELREHVGLRGDALEIYDEGVLDVPVFADEDHDVFAEFRLEFFREDEMFRTGLFHIAGEGPGEIRELELPARKQQLHMTVDLGPGSGGLDFRTVRLRTDLPRHGRQYVMWREGLLRRFGYVKVMDVRIYTLPRAAPERFALQAGGSNSGAYFLSGVHGRENHLGRYPVRWTTGDTALRLPAGFGREPHWVTLTYFDVRPDPEEAMEVEVWLEGEKLRRTEHAQTGPDNMYTVVFEAPGEIFETEERLRLRVESPSWSPAEVGGDDTRTLGVMLHEVIVEPLSVGEESP